MSGPVPPLPDGDAWADLLLDELPDVGLLDGLQMDFELGGTALPPDLDPLDGLDCLGLDPSDAAILGDLGVTGAASVGSHPTSSDLLESLQLEAADYVAPASSSGARHSPGGSGSGSGSGCDSPVVLQLMSGAPHVPSPAVVVAAHHQHTSSSPLRSSYDHASPATSESENDGQQPQRSAGGSAGSGATAASQRQHVSQADGSPTAAGAATSQQLQGGRAQMSEEEKRLARMQRNRENAQLSRQRKKQQMSTLEGRCAVLAQQNAQLTGVVQRLTAENATLRQQLALVCHQAGRNAAVAAATKAGAPNAGATGSAAPVKAGVAGAAAKPGTVARAAGGAAAAAPAAKPATAGVPVNAAAKPAAKPAMPVAQPAKAAAASAVGQPVTLTATSASSAAAAAMAARGLIPQWPLLPFAGFLPKVTLPIQQQQQQQQKRPAPAPSTAPAAQPRPAPVAAAATAKAAPAAAAPKASARAPKRARTAAAGASTAFLALFTLFMFAGPFSPPQLTLPASGGPSTTLATAGPHRSLQALPNTALSTAAPAAVAAAAAAGGGAGGRHLLSIDDDSNTGSTASSGGLQQHTGHSLQTLPALPSGASPAGGSSLAALQRPPHMPLDLTNLSSAWEDARGAVGGSRLQQLLNSTLQALLEQPGNAQLEAAALQRLQELGPVALLLDADVPGAAAGSNPLAASVAFPQLAEQLFGGAGLEVPQMCHKVLEFDAASVPHAARSRRSLERYVLGATGFRGRSLAGALPAAGSQAQQALRAEGGDTARERATVRIEEVGEEGQENADVGGGAGGGDGALLPTSSAAGGPVLVSILLPANASGGGNRSSASGGPQLAAIDKVFVVLLHPNEKYVTYSCALPRTVVL